MTPSVAVICLQKTPNSLKKIPNDNIVEGPGYYLKSKSLYLQGMLLNIQAFHCIFFFPNIVPVISAIRFSINLQYSMQGQKLNYS